MTKFYGDDEIVNLFFRLAEQLQKFQLTHAERALFTVITLLSPGNLIHCTLALIENKLKDYLA